MGSNTKIKTYWNKSDYIGLVFFIIIFGFILTGSVFMHMKQTTQHPIITSVKAKIISVEDNFWGSRTTYQLENGELVYQRGVCGQPGQEMTITLTRYND